MKNLEKKQSKNKNSVLSIEKLNSNTATNQKCDLVPIFIVKIGSHSRLERYREIEGEARERERERERKHHTLYSTQ